MGTLTARELEVLRLVADGATDKQIAEALVLSKYTVWRHVGACIAKLDQATRTGAAVAAVREGVIE